MVRWRNNVARGSRLTGDVYFRRLRGFCNDNTLTPESIKIQAKIDPLKFQNLLEDYVARLEREGKAGSYVETILKAVRSWLTYNDIKLNRRIKIKGANATPTIEDERVPTNDELKRIINTVSGRGRVSIVLMSQSGLRPQVLGNGMDGLRIKDLPELSISEGKVSFGKIPAMIIVRQILSKAGNKYLTFMSSEGCDYLSAYLQERINAGEELTPESPVLGYDARGKASSFRDSDHPFPTTKTITSEIRHAIRSAGFDWRPYVLRAYFDTQLLLAESQGKMTHAYRQFLMGHKGDMEARYTTEKGRLPDAMIDDMRSSYRDSENFLLTTPRVEGMMEENKQIQLDMAKKLLTTLYPGLDLEVTIKNREREMKRTLSADESLNLILDIVGTHKKNTEQSEEYKVVHVDQLEDFLNKNPGWKPKQSVNHDKFLVERTATRKL